VAQSEAARNAEKVLEGPVIFSAWLAAIGTESGVGSEPGDNDSVLGFSGAPLMLNAFVLKSQTPSSLHAVSAHAKPSAPYSLLAVRLQARRL
jgi:hypothetical protein